MYRDACDGIDTAAFSPVMGLPPFYAPRYVAPELGSRWAIVLELKCGSPTGYPDGSRPPEYVANWPICFATSGVTVEQVEAEQRDWISYVQREGLGSVVLFDPNHQKHFPATALSNQFAMGMTLAGGLKVRTRRGDCTDRRWWEGG
jgi:hypothetical protein